jgi:NAD(P)-dependent dehydrogenase (short-subunit alcohol dehydrogenase family)
MKHELAQMRAQGSGAIVNCSSLGRSRRASGRAAYHASKHGMMGVALPVNGGQGVARSNLASPTR